jgi:tetratricopeptide (TPR) repeat protein
VSSALNTPLGPYLEAPIKLFIADTALLKQTKAVLEQLKFQDVRIIAVQANYFMAMRQLFSELSNFDGVILVNHPPQKVKDTAGMTYEDMSFEDFYKGVASFNKSSRRSTSDLLNKCVPIFISAQDSDIRMRIVEELFSYGIMAAFMLRVQDYRMPAAEQLEERIQELQDYLLEFFLHRNQKLTEFKEYKSAEDLKERRAKSESLMEEVERLKQAKEFDKAIALCRQAIEVLPTDPGAYLESGKLLVKKKKYPPALQMFRDAEKVADDLPAPNQEIANLRVEQVKDYVQKRTDAGLPIEENVIENYLSEANDNFEAAIKKAQRTQAVRSQGQDERRKDAVAGIAENILTLGMQELLGPTNPLVRKLGQLAQETLSNSVQGEGELAARHLIQFGLMAFFDGDLPKALKNLKKAAQDPESFEEACKKLNYIGTQLRQRDSHDEAVKVYNFLLSLKPSFRGVVLFNLAVALESKANELRKSQDSRANAIANMAVGTTVESLYVDPNLTSDPNFYANTVMYHPLVKLVKLFRAAASQPNREPEDPTEKACRQASERLENLLLQKKDKEALSFMFSLAQKLTPYFTGFDKHATPLVLDFAKRLNAVLKNNPKPKMRTFGKILGVLVAKGSKKKDDSALALSPLLNKVMAALNKADQARAAHELAILLVTRPQLLKTKDFQNDRTITNLCREIYNKLSSIEFDKFT